MASKQSATPKRARSKRDDKKQAGRGTSQNGDGNEAATFEQELAHYLQERIKPGLNRGSIPLLARSIAKEVAQWRPGEDADGAGEPSGEEDDELRGEADDEFDEEEDDDVRGEADDEFDEEEDDDVRGEAGDEDDEEDDDDVRGEADDEDDEEDDDDVRGEADDDFDDEDDDEEDDDVQAEAGDAFGDEEDGDGSSLEDEMRDLQAKLGDDWILRVSVQREDVWLTAEKDDGSQHVEAPAAHVLADVVELLNEGGGRSS